MGTSGDTGVDTTETPRLGLVGILLTFAAGSVDAACFVGLGGVFASVMTGNMVLLGTAAGRSEATLAISTGVALVGYAVGTATGSILTRGVRASPTRRFAVSIGTELLVLGGFTAAWESFGARPAGTGALVTLSVAALAMGVQGAAALDIERLRLPTTYMTGTLTRLVVGVLTGAGLDRRGVARLVALVLGALVTALLVRTAPVLTPVPALGAVLASTAILAARVFARRPRRGTRDGGTGDQGEQEPP